MDPDIVMPSKQQPCGWRSRAEPREATPPDHTCGQGISHPPALSIHTWCSRDTESLLSLLQNDRVSSRCFPTFRMPLGTKSPSKANEPPILDRIPTNWPDDVQFLHDQAYSAAVTPEMKDGLSRSTGSNVTLSTVPPEALQSPSVTAEIRIINDAAHPAHGQRGLFASQNLPPDSFICLYLGHVHTNSLSDTDPHSDYDLSYDRDLGLSIDSARCGNEARFINDYRGIAERPNAEFRDCLVQAKSEKRAGGVKLERRVGIFVLSAGKAGKRVAGVREGEEVLVNYGKGFWEARQVVAKFRKNDEMRMTSSGDVKLSYWRVANHTVL